MTAAERLLRFWRSRPVDLVVDERTLLAEHGLTPLEATARIRRAARRRCPCASHRAAA